MDMCPVHKNLSNAMPYILVFAKMLRYVNVYGMISELSFLLGGY